MTLRPLARTLLRILILALCFFLLSLGCSYASRISSDSARTLQVESNHYYDTNVYVFCDGAQRKRISHVILNERRTVTLRVPTCYEAVLIIETIPLGDSWIIPPFSLSEGECVALTIGHRLPHSSILPCSRA